MSFRARVSDIECKPRQDDEKNANELSGVNRAAPNVDDGTPETLESFLSNTTLHGAQYLFARSTVRRLLWSLALLASLAFCNYQAYQTVREYLQRPFNTKISSKSAHEGFLIFPAVSLCNFNPSNMNKIKNLLSVSNPDLSGEEVQELADEFSKILIQSNDVITEDFQERFRILFNHDNLEAITEAISHQIEEMLLPNVPPTFISCSYAGLFCGAQNFSSFMSTVFGQCFTFNSRRNGNALLKATMAGKNHGLKLRLNIQRDSYIKNGKNPLAGITVLVHDQDNYPFMLEYGFSVQPGSHTFCSIKMKKVLNPKIESGYSNALSFIFIN